MDRANHSCLQGCGAEWRLSSETGPRSCLIAGLPLVLELVEVLQLYRSNCSELAQLGPDNHTGVFSCSPIVTFSLRARSIHVIPLAFIRDLAVTSSLGSTAVARRLTEAGGGAGLRLEAFSDAGL